MDGVTAFALERPGYALLAIALAFAFNLLLQAAAWLAFRRYGAVTALTAALVSGNCNMGLVLVALAGHAISRSRRSSRWRRCRCTCCRRCSSLSIVGRAPVPGRRIAGSGAAEVK